MKKIILLLAVSFTAFSAFASDDDVNARVLNAFNKEFTSAKEVEWTVASNYYQARFMYNEKYVFAFYTLDGQLIGLTSSISPADLPADLQASLKKQYSEYWISDLFEVAKNDETAYYVTLENADCKIVLRSVGGSDWEVYKKVKKA